jgi:hypothetical protein
MAAVGLRELLRIAQGGDLYVDQDTTEIADEWRRAANPVVDYVQADYIPDPVGKVSSSAFLSGLNEYQARRYHGKRQRITPRQLSRYMDAEGYIKVRASGFETGSKVLAGEVCWQGLRSKYEDLGAFAEVAQ